MDEFWHNLNIDTLLRAVLDQQLHYFYARNKNNSYFKCISSVSSADEGKMIPSFEKLKEFWFDKENLLIHECNKSVCASILSSSSHFKHFATKPIIV